VDRTREQQSVVLKRPTSAVMVQPFRHMEFSPRNFYLDSRTRFRGKQHIRHVALDDPAKTFTYTTTESWGAL